MTGIGFRRISLSHVNKSETHAIQTGKDDKDVQMKVKVCLEMIDAIKRERAPSGVVIDKSAVST
jgi:hypothetical protein